MARWERLAALGMEVVPEVNWMFMMSRFERGDDGSTEDLSPSEVREWNGVSERYGETSIRPLELSRRMTCFRD